ncbi:MAG: HigA family addiction module antidote protein, partial [Gammaproteobacteria bacterium]|nr:HigA family addiction module antidote protein [Gammaproteobacteria bacterium]
MIDKESKFSPDWISPPGETISDLLEERDWNQVELARRLGFTTKHLNQLIKGKASLSEDAALRLERVLGSTAKFWLNREAIYREQLARQEARKRYEDWTDWLDRLPLSWLKIVGVIPDQRITESRKPELVETLLKYFSVASPNEWKEHYENLQGSFRCARDENSDIGAITSWLRMGEIEAEKIEAPKYSKVEFEKVLNEIRALTVLSPCEIEPKIHAMCRQAGVKLVLVHTAPIAHVSGVARWLNLHSPLIQLSLYEKTNDKFWFAFFHEAAHILLHADNKQNIYLDDLNIDSNQRS